jgi:hypothetical protein
VLIVFDGVAGQRVSLEVLANSYPEACYSIYKPSNSQLVAVSCLNSAGGALGPATLPRTGTYTVLIDLAGTGSLSFKLHEVPPDVVDSFAPTAEGAAKTVTTTTPGQKARVTFSGSAAQPVARGLFEWPTFPVQIRASDLARLSASISALFELDLAIDQSRSTVRRRGSAPGCVGTP